MGRACRRRSRGVERGPCRRGAPRDTGRQLTLGSMTSESGIFCPFPARPRVLRVLVLQGCPKVSCGLRSEVRHPGASQLPARRVRRQARWPMTTASEARVREAGVEDDKLLRDHSGDGWISRSPTRSCRTRRARAGVLARAPRPEHRRSSRMDGRDRPGEPPCSAGHPVAPPPPRYGYIWGVYVVPRTAGKVRDAPDAATMAHRSHPPHVRGLARFAVRSSCLCPARIQNATEMRLALDQPLRGRRR
jgi:hypothetical protein